MQVRYTAALTFIALAPPFLLIGLGMKLSAPIIYDYLSFVGYKAVTTGEDKLKICCPFHDDTTPSAEISVSASKFACYAASCGVHGDLVKLFAKITEAVVKKPVPYESMASLLCKRYGIAPEGGAPLAIEPIEAAHQAIFAPNPLVAAIKAKGITEELIRRYRLGFNAEEGRIWIPVPSESGTGYVNVRKYLPNAPGVDKMRNVKGRSEPHLYPYDQVRYPSIMVCGGEMKALVALNQLNAYDVGAVAVTGSEGSWSAKIGAHFAGKVVYVCLDVDKGGIKATAKLCKKLYGVAKAVYSIALPLDLVKYPKGDINNFVHDEGGNLWELIKTSAVEYVPKDEALQGYEEGEYEERNIHEAIKAENVGKRSTIGAQVVGVAEERYSLPKLVQVTCEQGKDYCIACNVYARKARPLFEVPAESPYLLAMVGAPNASVIKTLRANVVGIPEKCKEHTLNVLTRYGAELVAISPPTKLSHSADTDARTVQKALVLGDGIEPNEDYTLQVRSQADPRNQETVLIASSNHKSDNVLDSLNANLELLNIFRAEGDSVEAIDAKLQDIWLDLSCNVTKIYKRPEIHAAIDLSFHSALLMDFDGTTQKAYTEVLVIGDTGQGKSEVTTKLQKFYDLGKLVDCANATTAGLIGGLQQIGGLWLITWGTWVQQDGKLVILEEVKRAPVELIASLTDTRSSGVAKQDKIRAGRRLARARSVWLSNPRSDRPVRSYGNGVEAVLELIGNPEDVRRFDFALCVSSQDLDGDIIHASQKPVTAHKYTDTACRNLVLWTWKLKPSDIFFSPEAREAILTFSKELSKKYSDQIPLVDNGTIRLKLARLSIAVAARLYNEQGGKLVVTANHVAWLAAFLQRCYDSKAMGYDRYSANIAKQETLNSAKTAAVTEALKGLPYAREAVEYMRTSTFIKTKELAMLAGTSDEAITGLLGCVMRAGGLVYRGNNMILSAGFRAFLSELNLDNLQTMPERKPNNF